MKKEKRTLIVLLDMHAILHRGYHAMAGFTSKNGEPSGALYSCMMVIIDLLTKYNPAQIIACYDMPEATFRHVAYEAYKAGRKQTEDALIFQINESRNMIELCGIPIFGVPGFEADDLLGSFCHIIPKDFDIMIASGDMDTTQLVDKKRITVFTLRKGIKDTIVYDEKGVNERYGFGPKLLPDFKALYGDAGDNIKGIKGIGEKTATTLIKEFGSIEKIYKVLEKNPEKIEEVTSKRIRGLLETGKEDAEFSKILATIRTDAPVLFNPEYTIALFENKDKLLDYLDRFSMKTIISKLKNTNEYKDSIKKDNEIGLFDTPEEVYEKFDISYTLTEQIKVAYWLIYTDKTNPDIHEIMSEYQGKKPEEVLSFLLDRISLEKMDLVYSAIEAPLIPILQSMKEKGIMFDMDKVKILSLKINKEVLALETEIQSMAGLEFNVRSPKQLGEVLYEKMGLGKSFRIAKKASGGYSTKESELEKMIDEHPIIKKLLEYRELHKMQSTYIDALPSFVESDGAIHGELLQYGASTGRFASQNPNLQNIPQTGSYAKLFRECFVARAGYQLVSCDYSQIELRIAAILAKDEVFLEIFNSGRDIHSEVASRVWKKPADEITKDMRRKAKVINFGILYGMGATALSKDLETSRKEAETYIEEYFSAFPKLKQYLEETRIFALKNKYTETLFGRRRYYNIPEHLPEYIKASFERMMINAPIQGTATADIVKLALIKTAHFLNEKYKDNAYPILQIHDEIVFEIKNEYIDELLPKIKQIMSHVSEDEPFNITLPIPLIAESHCGENLGNMNK